MEQADEVAQITATIIDEAVKGAAWFWLEAMPALVEAQRAAAFSMLEEWGR